MFHATFKSNIDNILSEGLIQKNINWKEWSEKGYIYLTKTVEQAKIWMKDLFLEHPNQDIDDIAIFSVKTENYKVEQDIGENYKIKGKILPEDIKLEKIYSYEELMKE